MKKILILQEMMDEVWDKPPRDTWEQTEESLEKNFVDTILLEVNDIIIGGCMVYKIARLTYGIGNFVIKKEYQRRGYGKRLLKLVENKYQGLFILKTKKAEVFWKKNGYITINKIENIFYMNKLTDKEAVYY